MTDVAPPRVGFVGKLWKHKWVILATTVLGAGSALIASRWIPETYRSHTLVIVVGQKVPQEYVRPTVTTSFQDRLQAITATILSRTRLEQTIEQFKLYSDERKTQVMEDVIQRMRDDIHVDIAAGDTFTVSYDSPSPYTAQKVAESITSSFIQESLQDRELLAVSTNQFLEGTAEETRHKLEETEKNLAEIAAKNGGRQPSQIPVIQYEALQQTYKSLMVKLEESRIAARLETRQLGDQFKLLEAARVPEAPVSVNRARLNTIGALAGFAVGVFFVGTRRRS